MTTIHMQYVFLFFTHDCTTEKSGLKEPGTCGLVHLGTLITQLPNVICPVFFDRAINLETKKWIQTLGKLKDSHKNWAITREDFIEEDLESYLITQVKINFVIINTGIKLHHCFHSCLFESEQNKQEF